MVRPHPHTHTHTHPHAHTHTHVQSRQPLPLATLRTESCPRISAHDLITLCRLDPQSLGNHHHSNTTSNLLLGRGGAKGVKRSRQRGVIVDIRSVEEFRQGHVTNSLSVPQDTAFLADGSLSPSSQGGGLTRVPRGRVLVVMGSKADTGQVVSTDR